MVDSRGRDPRFHTDSRASVMSVVKLVVIGVVTLAFVSLQFGTGIPAIDGTVDDFVGTGPVVDSDAGPERQTPAGSAGEPATVATGGSDDEVVDGANETRIERLVHAEVNERRADRGLSRLAYDPALAAIADDYSVAMAQRDFFAHVDPDGDDFADRYEEAGYRCRVSTGGNRYATGGENLAQSWWERQVRTDRGTAYYDTERGLAEGVVDQWMNSTGHRENILMPHWEHEGIGVDITASGKVLVTQNFC